jgi:hypothetical protein
MPAAPATVAAVIATISPRAAISRGTDRPAAIAPAPWQAEPVGHDGERDHLGHADPGGGQDDRGERAPQQRVASQVAQSRRHLREAQAAAAGGDVRHGQARQAGGRDEERRRIEHRHQRTAAGHVQRSAGHGRDDPDPRPGRLEQAVRGRQQVVGDDAGDEAAARRRAQLLHEPVPERDRVDDPHVAAVVDGEQPAHQPRREQVVRDQHAPAGEAVGDHARHRCEQPADREEAEGETAGTGRAGQVERPDPEHDEQGAVAEQAGGVPGEQAPEGGVMGEAAHVPSVGPSRDRDVIVA